MEVRKEIVSDGNTYIITHDVKNNKLIIEKKTLNGNIQIDINNSIEEYKHILETYEQIIKKDEKEIIVEEIKKLIVSKTINNYEELNKYYSEKAYDKNMIDYLNKELSNTAKENFIETKVYDDVIEKLTDELLKKRNKNDFFNIEFYKENGVLKIDAKTTINGSENYLFDKEISFEYTQDLEENFINKFTTRFAERQHHDNPKISTYAINEADISLYSASNAKLNIKGISDSYAYSLEEIINKTPVKNIDNAIDEYKNNDNMSYDDFVKNNQEYANNPEVAKQKYEDYLELNRSRVRKNEINNKGNIIIKIFIILFIEAFIALALITYLLVK